MLNIVMIGLLFWIFYEDLKDREITLFVMLGLLCLGGYLNLREHLFEIFLMSTLMNVMMVSLVLLILWLYSKVKLKSGLFQVFGTGDLLFFLFMAVSFPITSFLVLFSCSLFFALIFSVVFKKRLTKWVPLAGIQALFLGLIVGANQVFEVVNLYAF